jgi:hypothetical protein
MIAKTIAMLIMQCILAKKGGRKKNQEEKETWEQLD